jgi:hypothetical protein
MSKGTLLCLVLTLLVVRIAVGGMWPERLLPATMISPSQSIA